MSSTTNTQNLLTNVFRPTFVYNTVTSNYQMKLELTNVDIVSANTVTSFAANIGDENGNLYLGTGSGNAYSTLAASSNTTNTFVGTGAGGATSNVKNGVFIGYRAGYGASNSSNSISIGANTLNGGNSNIYIGCATGIATGSNNIFLGAGVSNGGASTCNTLIVGSGSNTMLFGDLVNKRLAVNQTSLTDPSTFIVFDVNGYTRIGPTGSGVGGLGINTNPGQGFTLDVNGNMRVSDGYGRLILSNDSNANSVTTLAPVVSGKFATLGVSSGLYSSQGLMLSTDVNRTIVSNAEVLPGTFMVSAESPDGSLYDYGLFYRRRAAYGQLSRASNTTLIGTSTTTGVYLAASGSNLNWNLAFFPSVLVPPTVTLLGGGIVSTLAGSGASGSNNATGTLATFRFPTSISVVPSSGNLIVSEPGNNLIRQITPAGVVTTFAGSGTAGFADGTGILAVFNTPGQVDVDRVTGNIVVGDAANHRIRLITPGGVVSTLAGSNPSGYVDATGTAARFFWPEGCAFLQNGNIAVADTSNVRIRMVTPGGVVTTLAGGSNGYADGVGSNASFSFLAGIAVVPSTGAIVVADKGNYKIRLVTTSTYAPNSGVVTTITSGVNIPMAVAVIPSNGNILVADRGTFTIKMVTPTGTITTFAGSGSSGSNNGAAASATFNTPFGVAVNPNSDLVYVGDLSNNLIRQITMSYT